MVELIAEGGYDRVTVRALTRRARVSSRSFYHHFANTEECLTFASDWTIQRAVKRAVDDLATPRDFEHSVVTSLRDFLEELSRDPAESRVALIDIHAARDPESDRPPNSAAFEALLHTSINASGHSPGVPRPFLRAMAAGITRVARKTATEGHFNELSQLSEILSGWILGLSGPEFRHLSSVRVAVSIGMLERASTEPLPRRDASFDERSRLLAAVLHVARKEGRSGLSIARVRKQAGVSRPAFDAHFDDLSTCVRCAAETFAETVAAKPPSSRHTSVDQAGLIYADVLSLACNFRSEPHLAEILLRGAETSGLGLLAYQDQLISRGSEQLGSRMGNSTGPAGPGIAQEASVAAALQLADGLIRSVGVESLPKLAPLVTYVLVAPTVGPARAVAAIGGNPPDRPDSRSLRADKDPTKRDSRR